MNGRSTLEAAVVATPVRRADAGRLLPIASRWRAARGAFDAASEPAEHCWTKVRLTLLGTSIASDASCHVDAGVTFLAYRLVEVIEQFYHPVDKNTHASAQSPILRIDDMKRVSGLTPVLKYRDQ
jgi:hypothetical protein